MSGKHRNPALVDLFLRNRIRLCEYLRIKQTFFNQLAIEQRIFLILLSEENMFQVAVAPVYIVAAKNIVLPMPTAQPLLNPPSGNTG